VNYDNRENLVEELEILERLKIVTLRRRLNAGILLIPEGMQPATEQEYEDQFALEDVIVESVAETVHNVDSLGTICPIFLRGPAELLDSVRLIKFSDNDIDLETIEDRIETVKSRMHALDMASENLV
jgi:hypothetical protein